MKVKIPFLERFREPMLSGRKTMTSRSKKYGEYGDTFDVFGATFEIVEPIARLSLGDIASFWREEGFESLEDFVECWTNLHPRVGYDVNRVYYCHIFKKAIKDD